MPFPCGGNNDRFNCGAIDSEYIYCTYANGTNQYIYDVNNDKRICIDKGNLRQFYRAEGSDYGYFFTTDFGLIKYDLKNDRLEETLFKKAAVYSWASLGNNGIYVMQDPYNEGTFNIFDPATEESNFYDLRQYDYPQILQGYNDYVFAEVKKNSESYFGVFDKNCEPLFEPFKSNGLNYILSKDYIILYNDESYYAFDLKTNELKTCADSTFMSNNSIRNFDYETNTILIEVEEDGNSYYYLADASDPTNYYSPLDK